jgi:hypothetical protein
MAETSDELQDHLQKLLHKSLNLRKQADEIDAEVEALRRLIAERCPQSGSARQARPRKQR